MHHMHTSTVAAMGLHYERVMYTGDTYHDRCHLLLLLLPRTPPSQVVLVGDGQATQGDYIVKHTVRKVRRLGSDRHPALAGFAGVAVDGLALLERLEGKLTEHPGQLLRAAVELAKMWRQARHACTHGRGTAI
jgi:Proteasome subunit